MRKIISRVLLLTMVLSFCLPIANYVYAKENIKVTINDACIDEGAYVETIEERLYVSARSVANPMGLNLEWNDAKKTLMISHQDTIISLIVAADFAIVNNQLIETERPLKIVSDRAIIDLGFVCDVLNADMTFNESENAYHITIDVPKDFQPDVIKPAKDSNEVFLFTDSSPEMTRVKEVAEALGLEAEWEDSVKALTLTSEIGDALTLYVGDNTAWFNGEIIQCSAPLKIINDEAYIEYEFVEKLFTVKTPETYIPARKIADTLGLSVEWIDETKSVEFVNKNGDVLRMSVGSCYYALNDKFYDNSAPLALKNGVALTDPAIIKDAFENKAVYSESEEIELFATKDFSGQFIFEKSFSSKTYINVTVVSVNSMVYNNTYGLTYSDYNTQKITVPANTKTVDFSVTKSNWVSSNRYIIGYSFPSSNSYYYSEGWLSSSGGILTALSRYASDYTMFKNTASTSDITIKPKLYYGVTPDDAVFSGTIKTDNGVTFGTGSSLNVSVRSATYYGESILASTTLYPGNTSSAKFSLSVQNNSTNRNQSLYLRYSLSGGDDSIITSGYYKSSTESVKNRYDAKGWRISYDNLSNINFVVICKDERTVSGTFYLPAGMQIENSKGISLGIDILTVQSSVYSKYFYSYASFDNVASINPGESYAKYSFAVSLDDGDTYIFKYRVLGSQQGIFPYGYATYSSYNTNPDYASLYTTSSSLSGIDFNLQKSTNEYTYVNNLPHNVINGKITSSSGLMSNGRYFEGYYVYLTKGETVNIELKSSDFDAYLYLLDENMNIITTDDEGLGYGNARINCWIGKSGYYYIHATTYFNYNTGKFSLNINTDRPLSGGSTFTDSSYNTISSISSNSLIRANYKVENTYYNTRNVILVMALYDNNNALLDVKTKNVSVAPGITDTEYLTMDLKNIKNVAKIKSFIWSDKLAPAGNADYLYK